MPIYGKMPTINAAEFYHEEKKNQNRGIYISLRFLKMYCDLHYVSHVMRKQIFAFAKTKEQISCAVTGQLISVFVFASRIVNTSS